MRATSPVTAQLPDKGPECMMYRCCWIRDAAPSVGPRAQLSLPGGLYKLGMRGTGRELRTDRCSPEIPVSPGSRRHGHYTPRLDSNLSKAAEANSKYFRLLSRSSSLPQPSTPTMIIQQKLIINSAAVISMYSSGTPKTGPHLPAGKFVPASH